MSACLSGSAAGGDSGGCGQLLFDFFVHAGPAKLGGDADGVLDCVGIRAAVADDGDAANSQERGATLFRVVGALAESVKCFL
jgi:hypothetical protein